MNSARPIAWAAFFGGTAASVAANVTHAYLATPDHEIGPEVAAAFWPLALLAAIEVITRVPWPSGWLWSLARYVGTGTVALGAATLSYRHMANLLAVWGEDAWNAHIGPLVVDGLMVVAGTALLAMGKGAVSASAATRQARIHESAVRVAAASAGLNERLATAPAIAATEAPMAEAPSATPNAKRQDANAEVRAAAHDAYREALSEGRKLTGAQLGDQFGRSSAWGRARIAELQTAS